MRLYEATRTLVAFYLLVPVVLRLKRPALTLLCRSGRSGLRHRQKTNPPRRKLVLYPEAPKNAGVKATRRDGATATLLSNPLGRNAR